MDVLLGELDRVRMWRPLAPYDQATCALLDQLSAALLADPEARQYPDVATFAFWARRANVDRLRTAFVEPRTRIGRGLAFHIAPANVPITFAFSWAFALLAGNASIVRVPSQPFPQVAVVCRVLQQVMRGAAPQAAGNVAFVRYGRSDEITAELSAGCAARIVWGSDATIADVRRTPLPVRSIELVFSDRYSFAVIDAAAILALDEAALKRLATGFYNDTLLMDQNACSSPHLLLWHATSAGAGAAARARFWPAVEAVSAQRYELPAVHAVDRYTQLCEFLAELDGVGSVEHKGLRTFRVALAELPRDVQRYRGRFGLFFEHDIASLDAIGPLVTPAVQTLTYFGLDPDLLARRVLEGGWRGIDRIAPFGTALDLDVFWDGVDVIRALSRIVDVR
jgi:hypothetical protein